MATTGEYGETSSRSHSKRKRGEAEDSEARGRRSNFGTHTVAATSLADPTEHTSYLPPGTNGDGHTEQFDLSALQQAQSSQGVASDTAAAALTHYSMNVPSHPAQDFLNEQGPGGDYMDSEDYSVLQDGVGNKPPVGSEQWHKVRKDNHKEGVLNACSLSRVNICSGTTSSRDYQRGHQRAGEDCAW